MTSGIGDFFKENYMQTPKDKIRNLDDYLPFFAGDSMLFEPGKGRVYSNGDPPMAYNVARKINAWLRRFE
jgi:hypothetical protein